MFYIMHYESDIFVKTIINTYYPCLAKELSIIIALKVQSKELTEWQATCSFLTTNKNQLAIFTLSLTIHQPPQPRALLRKHSMSFIRKSVLLNSSWKENSLMIVSWKICSKPRLLDNWVISIFTWNFDNSRIR